MTKHIIAAVFLSTGLASGASHAIDCSGLENWDSSQPYVGGNQVQYNGNAYRANYWTQNHNPETRSGPWQEWNLLGACNGGSGSNQAPRANANGPYAGQAGDTISFSSAGSSDPDGTIVSYNWNFGDGNSSNSANPSHSYGIAGSYSVSLTVTDNDGAAATASSSVTIGGGGGSPGGSCAGLPVYSAGTAYAAGQRVVNFVQSSGQNVEFVCNIAGWCSLNAAWAYEPGNGAHWREAWSEVGACGGGSGTNLNPVANANGPYQANSGEAIRFSSAGSSDPDGTIASYDWNFGDGNTSNAANPTHSYAATGTYNVTLTVTDNRGASASSATTATVGDNPPPPPPPPGGKKVVGYFTAWGVYQRNYHVKNIVTSGSAEKLTHIMYAFGNVNSAGRCVIGDAYADYDRFYQANESVDGVADTWDAGALRGNFNQLRKLKQMYPNIKVVWSFGGWTWSRFFGAAAANPAAFAESCYNLVYDPRWADVFDGIDIDWEYPNECGDTCDNSGFEAYGNLMAAVRARFGSDKLVTSAIPAGEAKLNAANYGAAAQYLDFYMLMTYDFFGGWAPQGPTAPHSPLTNFPSIPTPGFYSDNAVQVLKSKGVPANKILLGIGFYGRGWSGVSQSAPGGSASGRAPGTWEQGIEDYKVLKSICPATGTIAGTAYAHCGNNWWGYDTPATINGKMNYLKSQGLGGAFFWEFNGDTANGELINAISNGLN